MTLRVVAYDSSAHSRAISESQIQFELGPRLDQVERCHVFHVPHNLRNQLRADDLVTLQLLEQAGIEHLSQLAHPLEPHLILLEQRLHSRELRLIEAEPSFDFVYRFHALIGLEDEMIVGYSERHLLNALMQVQQLRMLLIAECSWYPNPRPRLTVEVLQDVATMSLDHSFDTALLSINI